MANIIRHKRSDTPGAIPHGSDLFLGELAVNTADGKLFTKKSDGTVVDLTTTGGLDGGELQYNSLLEGLMVFWRFDNQSGHVKDVSGNSKDMYEAVSHRKVEGISGSALGVDKRNFYYCNDPFLGHRTISMWIKFPVNFKGQYNSSAAYVVDDMVTYSGSLWKANTDVSGEDPSSQSWTLLGSYENEMVLASIDQFGSATAERIRLSVNPTSTTLQWIAALDGGQTPVLSGPQLPDNSWRHFVFVRDPNACRMYENGSLVSVVSSSGSPSNDSTAMFVIGKSPVVPFLIDCVGVWDKALTAEEINALYGSGDAYEFNSIEEPQIDYESFVTVNVEGPISSLSIEIGNSNVMYPSFSTEIQDYGILTSSANAGSSISYTITVNGSNYSGVSAVGKLIRVTDGTNDYYVRLFPSDMPIGTITTQPGAGYVPGYYVATSRRDINVNNYNIVYNEYGLPVWYVSNAGTPHLAQPGPVELSLLCRVRQQRRSRVVHEARVRRRLQSPCRMGAKQVDDELGDGKQQQA